MAERRLYRWYVHYVWITSHCWVHTALTERHEIDSVLSCYSLEELLELNELTESDAVYFMVEEEFITLPLTKPVDLDD